MQKEHTVYVRMPIEIYEIILEAAKREHRSVSKQIVYYVDKAICEEEKIHA